MPRVKKNLNNKNLTKIVDTVGRLVTFHREKAKLSQNALSKKAAISLSTINDIENKVVNDIRLSTVCSLAKALDLDPLILMMPANLKFTDSDKKALRKAVEMLKDLEKRLV